MPSLNLRVLSVVSSLAVLLVSSVAGMSSDKPPAIDLTKSSQGITNDNTKIVLAGVPKQETETKNELWLRSPAIVVGPIMEGIGQPRLARWRHEMLGQKVQVEGLALGKPSIEPSHMPSQRVIYEGGMIFIKGADFTKSKATSKLVHVVGTLCLEPESVMRFGGHPDIPVEKYYYIDVKELRVIESVTESLLVAPQLHE